MHSFEQIGSFIGALVLFVLILYGSYICSKKVAKLSLKENHSRYMRMVDRMAVGQDRYLTIVAIGDRCFLIGTSSAGVEILAELNEGDLVEAPEPKRPLPGGLDFKEIMEKLGHNREKKM